LKSPEWLVGAGVLAACAGAGALTGGENRLLNAAAAAGIIGLALFLTYTSKNITRTICLAVGAASIAGALAALIAFESKQAVCTAVNASGERVVIGTELTERGLQYKRKNPTDDNNMILETLGGLGPDLAWTAASIRRCRIALAVYGALWIPLFGVAAIAGAAISGIIRPKRAAQPVRTKPRAFLSYSHDDFAIASPLKQLLERHDIEVIIDRENMSAGERIPDFIRRSIRECDVVVSLISSRSLLSAWVASETIGAISRNKWGQDVSLVACYLDDQCFQPEFRLQCTQQIDQRLERIEQLLPEYAAKRIDTADLNEEKTRLYDLRNNLGTILATLKDSLCLDLRESQFKQSGQRLVWAVRKLWSERTL